MSVAAASTRVQFSLHGVSLSLDSEIDAFARYAGVALAPFVEPEPSPVRIESRLEWVEGAPQRDVGRAFGLSTWDRRPDRDLYLAGSSAYWLRIDDFEDLQLSMTWQQDRLSIRGRYHFRLGRGGRSDAVRRILYRGRLDALRARRFSTLVYYLVYHPILWLLSRERGWHVLHAGAVASRGVAAVFAGMPGCGKSTLAVGMLADRAWTMLSDNLLLHDGRDVLACPEPLLLDQNSLARVEGAAAARLRATGDRRVYERDAYRPDEIELGPVSPAVIFQTERGSNSLLEEISPADCARRIAADNLMAKEVRRIEIMNQVLDLVSGRSAPDAASATSSLVSTARCYLLRIAEGSGLTDALRRHIEPAILSATAGRKRARA